MGDPAYEKQTAKTVSTLDAAVTQRKPLPKGSDDARQPGEKPRAKKSGVMFDAHNSKHVAPNPHAGRDALRKAVELAESQVTVLNGKLDRVLAPEATIAKPCQDIALAVEMATVFLEESPPESGEIDAEIQRLDTAIGKLYVLARKHQIPMRETHLEEIFDREDHLRKLFTSLGPTHRADNYYDGDIELVDVTHESAPSAESMVVAPAPGAPANEEHHNAHAAAHAAPPGTGQTPQLQFGSGTHTDPAYWTDAGVGATGKEKKSDDNFLYPMERLRLENEFVARVSIAQMHYEGALHDMYAANLVAEPEELNVWSALFIAVVGKVAEFAIMKAVMQLKNAGAGMEKLAAAGIHTHDAKKAEEKILGVNASTVEGLVAYSVDKGKEKATKKATVAQGEKKKPEEPAPPDEAPNEAGADKKSATARYIGYLLSKSTVQFEHLRESKLESASDAELLAAREAYAAIHHTPEIYSTRLEHHVAVFKASHAIDIGHKEVDEVDSAGGGGHQRVRKEMRVAYVINGRKERQLVYMEKDYDVSPRHEPGDAYNSPDHALGLEETATWNDTDMGPHWIPSRHDGEKTQSRTQAAAVQPKIMGPVEPELHEAALAAQDTHWLQAPPTYMHGPFGWIEVK